MDLDPKMDYDPKWILIHNGSWFKMNFDPKLDIQKWILMDFDPIMDIDPKLDFDSKMDLDPKMDLDW